ncbi:MAG: VWA domain-containing protein [Blastocatellia bacterium]
MNVRTLGRTVLAAVILSVGVPVHAVQDGKSDVQLSAGEVLLDVIVTDKKGQPVTDLRRDEIEILENGTKQSVTSFGLVRKGPQEVNGQPSTATTSAEAPEAIRSSLAAKVNLIIIMVDRTSVEQAELKQVFTATEKFINEKLAINDLVAVFINTSQPLMIQNFTNNKPKLVNAMKIATAGSTILLQEAVTNGSRADLGRLTQMIAVGGGDLTLSGDAGDAQAAVNLETLLSSNAAGIESYFSALRDQIQALSIINSVVAIAQAYSEVPGRKSMVLYSAGLVLNNDVDSAFDAMVSAANRSNLTINTVGVRGLDARVARTNNEQLRNVRPILESDDRMAVSEGRSGMDRILESNLTDNDEGLARIAKDTGGVLIRNTNDLGKGFLAIANDLRTYYAMSYEPTNVALDGSFRSITVKVLRRDVEVRSRKGYFAVPGANSTLLLPFEQPVLAMLAKSDPQSRLSDLKVSFKTERFASPHGWRVPVALSIDGSALGAIPRDTKSKNPNLKGGNPNATDFEVNAVVLVRDARQTVVAKLSRTTVFRAANDRIPEFKAMSSPVPPFPQSLVLPPGSYTLQLGVYDPNSHRGTVMERKITLPPLPSDGNPALSSLVLGSAAVTVPESERTLVAEDPLVMGGKIRIVPNPTGRFAKSRGDRMIVYFQFRGAPNTPYEMILHFMSGEEVAVGTPPSPLGPTDASGMATAAPDIPLDGFKPGNYRAVLYIVPVGSKQPVAQAVTPFTVE